MGYVCTSVLFIPLSSADLGSLTTLVVELHLEKVMRVLASRIVVIALFVFSLAQSIIFTDQLPRLDILANPPGYSCLGGGVR